VQDKVHVKSLRSVDFHIAEGLGEQSDLTT